MIMEDIDAITPCPSGLSAAPTETMGSSPLVDLRPSPTMRSASPESLRSSLDLDTISRREASVKALEEGTNGDPDMLWKRMLALQKKFGCYNSARMSAALSSGNVSVLRPSKTCLDLLNENMAALPESVIDWLRPNRQHRV
ncbi:hypothetical protein F5B22DRAFT_205006 [Xylaria bambusicola]|uniref:uncharacterized protein n=1 Tax=Xylaria bambusicola TaxID=326684 RepID=UPI0020075B90|nr:uncharacterized protein F5B22DRAFT_205006 [Xylaria bambusicola]KAI0515164.1 hypothetical protein F5B22DRAFT_205006 [Xylaria bambusicola]